MIDIQLPNIISTHDVLILIDYVFRGGKNAKDIS